MQPPPRTGTPEPKTYTVHGTIQLVCWWVADPESLPLPPGSTGFYVYVFRDGERIGRMEWTWWFGDIQRAVLRFREIMAGRSQVLRKSADRVDIPWVRELVLTRGGRPITDGEPTPVIELPVSWENLFPS